MDKDHFLTLEKVRTLIDANSTSLDELLDMLPDSKKTAKMITRLAKSKDIDFTFTLAASKFGAIVSCDVCNAPRCIFSMKAIDVPGSPSER